MYSYIPQLYSVCCLLICFCWFFFLLVLSLLLLWLFLLFNVYFEPSTRASEHPLHRPWESKLTNYIGYKHDRVSLFVCAYSTHTHAHTNLMPTILWLYHTDVMRCTICFYVYIHMCARARSLAPAYLNVSVWLSMCNQARNAIERDNDEYSRQKKTRKTL